MIVMGVEAMRRTEQVLEECQIATLERCVGGIKGFNCLFRDVIIAKDLF